MENSRGNLRGRGGLPRHRRSGLPGTGAALREQPEEYHRLGEGGIPAGSYLREPPGAGDADPGERGSGWGQGRMESRPPVGGRDSFGFDLQAH